MPALANDPTILPPNLPAPVDDGAAEHLSRAIIPPIALPATTGGAIDLSVAAQPPSVFFFYPRTGVPEKSPPRLADGAEWDAIPGMRGCTPQSCGFRDLMSEFAALGVSVLAASTQTPEYQREFVARNHIPFPVLSDAELKLTRAMRLPSIEMPVESGGPSTLIKRMAWYCERGRIRKIWCPVFPPNENAANVLAWLKRRAAITVRPIGPGDAAFVREELTKHWGGVEIWSLGRMYRADTLPGFIAEVGAERAGLITYEVQPGGFTSEIVTVSSRVEGKGVGERLLEAALDAAQDAGCRRAMLTTTNDNTRAIGFYQRQGWRLARLHAGLVAAARQRVPIIPYMGLNGIPLRDEIELELWLQ